MLLTFQASAFDHSATCPLDTQDIHAPMRVRKVTGGGSSFQIGRVGPGYPLAALLAGAGLYLGGKSWQASLGPGGGGANSTVGITNAP